MRAEILSIGTELLLGEIVDTNAAYLARRLAALGIDCFHISQVGDNLGRATAAVRLALSRSDLLLTSGGLGPTEDDLTREAIAAAVGQQPNVDPELERELRSWFAARGLVMPERNRKQAWLIPAARAIANPHGTAPGWWVRHEGREIVAFPGVPREMIAMWEDHVEPELVARSGRSELVIRTLKLLGIGESALEEALGDLTRASFPTLATYAKSDGVHVRIAAKAIVRDEARAAVARAEALVRERVGAHVWGVDGETLAGVVDAAMRRRGWRLAVGDALTGGAFVAALCESGVPPWLSGAIVGAGGLPYGEVVLAIAGGDGVAKITARTPDGERTTDVRYGTPAEGRRRGTLAAFDALRRAVS